MAPGSAKRKRPDRQYSNDEGSRPSPHRPESLTMAQRMESNSGALRRGGGNSRRQSRQGGPADGVNAVPLPPRNTASTTPLQPQPSALLGTQQNGAHTDSPMLGTPIPSIPDPSRATQALPKERPDPYDYEHVTDEVVDTWKEHGRGMLLDELSKTDFLTMSTILQELVRSGLDGRLSPTDAGAVIKELRLMPQSEGQDVEEAFLNVISLLDELDTQKPSLLLLLAATDVDPEVVRQNLDVPLLTTLSLVRTSFNQIRARKTTNLLYRQANFNLLREETEGYAKLLTEYFTVSEESNKSKNPNVAEDAFQRIMALVGAFDLDVGRVLDITFDISANLLVKAYPFFIKFYRCSSWWPDGGSLDSVSWEDDGFNTFPAWALSGSGRLAVSEDRSVELVGMKVGRDEHFWEKVRENGMDAFFDLGARRIVDYDSVAQQLSIEAQPELDSRGKEITEDRRKRLNENRKYMRETRSLPASGNSDAAQLLGFKLRFYASSARDPEDAMPENLIHFTALLIKIGFISLRDIYPHLWPADEKMPEEKERLEKEKAEREAKERPGGGPNALALAAALSDDTPIPTRTLRSEKDKSGGATPKPAQKDEAAPADLPPPPNQKIALLKALLALGALPESLYILGRFPWLVDVDTSLPPYLHRIARHMLSKVAELVRPLASHPGVRAAKPQLESTTPKSDDTLTFGPRVPRVPTKWLGLEEVSDKDGVRYKYFYTQWADNIPVCQTLGDVFLLCDTLLGFLGVKIGHDTHLYGTLLRLARKSLAEDYSDANRQRWLELMKRLLVPALSLSKHNQSLSDEVYHLLMLYPITVRYDLYAEWFTGKTSRLPEMRVAFDHNKAEVKDVLRRVSNENVKTQSRALGRVSFSSPGVLIMFMINQLESYSNMIPAMVECTKYFSKLAYDVLTWCLINSLGGRGRERMQADGMLTSSWLQALSQFVASLFYRYSDVNPSPILQYLAFELRNGDSTDLEMLEQVLSEMTGIRADVDLNDFQVQCMAGGEHLRTRIMQQLGDARHARKAQAKRLIKALAEPGLIAQTLISIAQERQMYAHHESSNSMPLKVLSNNVDKIQQVFAQYLEVLKVNLKLEEFEAAMPDVVSLIGDFGLQPAIAFTIRRTILAHRMAEEDEERIRREKALQKQRKASREKTQSQEETGVRPADVDMNEQMDSILEDRPVVDGEAHEDPHAKAEDKSSAPLQLNGSADEISPIDWHPILTALVEGLPAVTGDLASKVSIPFFVTFWTLSPAEISPTLTEIYKAERKRLEDQVKEISRDRSDRTSAATAERSRKMKALTEVSNQLSLEANRIARRYIMVSQWLSRREKAHWFDRSRSKEDLNRRHTALLQECFIPRALMSPLDARYSNLMLRTLHDKGTPGFSTLVLLDRLMQRQQLAAIIFQCTGLEAQNLGRFLNEILKMLADWHADKGVYEEKALGGRKLPGFATGPLDYSASPETWTFMDYELYRQQLTNWHTALCGALQLCFESGEYMHIRNGIHVLKAIVGVFPALTFQGKALVQVVEKISQEDSRQDLKLMALSLLGPLKSREKQWVSPQLFRLNHSQKEGDAADRAASAKPETSNVKEEARSRTPQLNAAAPEFKPGTGSTLINGAVKKESLAGAEDGEVEEDVKAASQAADIVMKDVAEVKAADSPKPQSNAGERKAMPKPAVEEPPERSTTPKPNSSVHAPGPRQAANVYTKPRNESSLASSASGPRNLHTPLPRSEHWQEPAFSAGSPLPTVRAEGRYSRRQDDRYGRLDQPSEMRPASREHSPGPRSRARTPPASSRTQPREERDYHRGPRDDHSLRRDGPLAHSRPNDVRSRADHPTGPTSILSSANRPGYLSSVVSAPAPEPPFKHATMAPKPAPAPAPTTAPVPTAPTDTQFRVNPERQRIIEAEERRPSGVQQAATGRGDPRETERFPRASGDSRMNGRMYHGDEHREGPPRREQPTDIAPSGPRKGRLSREISHEELSYGQLNAPQESHMPPRPSNGQQDRSTRSFAAPGPPGNVRSGNEQPMHSPSGPRLPESPASLRPQPFSRQPSERHQQTPQTDRPSQPAAATTAPPLDAIHPDRARALGINTDVAAGGASSSPTSAPPSGPRATNARPPAGAPTGPSPVSSAPPPSGPASAVDRQRNHRQRGAINAALQGAQNGAAQRGQRQQDVSFRGASTRQNGFAMSSAAATPSVQSLVSPMEPPMAVRRSDGHIRDGAFTRPESRNDARFDMMQPNRDARDDLESASRREDERNRHERSSGRESRVDDHPPRRAPPPGAEEQRDRRDDRRPRDDRGAFDPQFPDRRGGPRPDGHRGPGQNMPGPFLGAPPGPNPAVQQGGYGVEPWRNGANDGRRGPRSSGRQEDFRELRQGEERRDGGGGGAGRMLPRPDVPPAERKRRHEEDMFDPTKRRRSGRQ